MAFAEGDLVLRGGELQEMRRFRRGDVGFAKGWSSIHRVWNVKGLKM